MQLILDNIIGLPADEISLDMLRGEAGKIPEFLEGFRKRGQGFLTLPRSKAQVLAVKHLAEKFRGRFADGSLEDVVVIGIGGSALGVTCLRDALKGPMWNMRGTPRVFVLDNLDLADELEAAVDLDKTLFIVISKSGGTPETMAYYEYFKSKVSRENFVFITDPENGKLRELGRELGVPMLDIPENIGGRFSVLSPVGLFPAALLGIDIEALLEGAEEVVASFESEEMDLNLPFQLAAVQYLLEWKYGVPMTVMMPYSTHLWSFADWYRQLLAESIGKDGKGLTPIRALGVTDQHSQLQLYNEGPNDKLIMFIEVEDFGMSEGKEALSKLMEVEKKATEKALRQYKKPNLTLRIPSVDAKNLGKLFMLMQCSIAFLGEYYRIDAFNQPGVELGKQLTRELLSS
jgi:glucose-6-phosphate isomerase